MARALRVVLLGGTSMALAAGAHLAGGGRLPGAGVFAVAALLLGLVAATLTARRCRFATLLVTLAAEQVGLHVLLDVAGRPHVTCGAMLGAHHTGALACLPDQASMAGSPMASPGAGMWLAHGAAVLVTAWLLARGEVWWWRVADRVVRATGVARPRLVSPATYAPVLSAPDLELSVGPHEQPVPRGPPSWWSLSPSLG